MEKHQSDGWRCIRGVAGLVVGFSASTVAGLRTMKVLEQGKIFERRFIMPIHGFKSICS